MNEKKKHSNFIAWIEKYQVILIPVITVLMSFIVASVIIMLLGKNPLTAFVNMLQGSGFLPKVKYAAESILLISSNWLILDSAYFCFLVGCSALKDRQLISGFPA